MEKIKYEMEVPKESKEIIDFLDAILEKVKAKAPLADYASLFGQASTALNGIDMLGDEAKSDGRDEIAAYMVHKLMSRLLPVEDAPAE